MEFELLIREAQGLSESSLMEVIRFMKFIKREEAEKTGQTPARPCADRSKWIRTPGGLNGKIVMTEGFDDPIDGFEEYM